MAKPPQGTNIGLCQVSITSVSRTSPKKVYQELTMTHPGCHRLVWIMEPTVPRRGTAFFFFSFLYCLILDVSLSTLSLSSILSVNRLHMTILSFV